MLIPSILKGQDMPKHLAINATRIRTWATKNNIDIKEAVKKNLEKLKDLIELQIKKDIPLLTIQLSTKNEEEIDGLKKFFKELVLDELIIEKKVRIYVIGNLNALEPDFVDILRNAMDKTKEYDHYFLNFCVKYDGHEEILAATKLLIRKALTEKISIDDLNVEQLKENLSSSYFMAPELMIMNNHHYNGLLLWDAKGSTIYFTDKYWLDFEKKDFDKAIDFFNQNKKKD
ncbi:hypothetical protein COV13_01615 [Candidatus Woesearchaeota archaeon CG10_big_fil_rev_8_21_14_0_10_32_9]|nr:MAG: hypothetical protein COV13_01615 [Candidatus Woesearchaeota archaeon CG10_big_fil_rev_8_21_14_0_10_32_9]